ncbi:MAG: type II toxin-antitoxin system VapC family toxin [Solirubrobacterales bacterium]
MTVVLDTTVLVYAKGTDHPLRDPCRSLISALADGRLEATTTPEVIQEFAHVRARRRDAKDAAALARDYAELLSPLLVIGREQLDQGLSLFETVSELGSFDAVLAAAALDADAAAVVSADRGFAAVGGLDHVFPDARGVAALLA